MVRLNIEQQILWKWFFETEFHYVQGNGPVAKCRWALWEQYLTCTVRTSNRRQYIFFYPLFDEKGCRELLHLHDLLAAMKNSFDQCTNRVPKKRNRWSKFFAIFIPHSSLDVKVSNKKAKKVPVWINNNNL